MTYLEIVNGVLRRLREDEVSTVNETTYSKMVGDFVNDAKRIIESRHTWSANRVATQVTTDDGVDTLSMSVLGSSVPSDTKILTAYNASRKWELEKVSQAYMEHVKRTNPDAPTGAVRQYTYYGLDINGNITLRVHPRPSGSETLAFYVFKYQADLSDDADELNIPALPVILYAVAMLAEEKGEAGGATSARYFQMAERVLSDAILADVNKNPEEWVWYQV